MLNYPEQLALIALTTTRLAPLRRYAEPARPSNDNQKGDNRDWNTDNSNACLRLVDKVGAFWVVRRAALLAVANRPLWIIILSLL